VRVAAIQSNYIPWKGYFDVIHDVDRFVFYDCVQYTPRDWRNRNLIKAAQGPLWLTVPVVAGARDRAIQDVAIAGHDWAAQHWKSIAHHYATAPHLARYRAFLEDVYLGRRWERLSELNQFLVTHIARELLGCQTEFVRSSDYRLQGQKQARLLDLLTQAGATSYLSGPAARAYIEPAAFAEAGIALAYMDYSAYPAYPQPHGAFTHGVSILDTLLQLGPDAPQAIWGARELAQRIPQAAPLAAVDAAAGLAS